MEQLQQTVSSEISSGSSLSDKTSKELDRAMRVMLWRTPNGADAIRRKSLRDNRRKEQLKEANKLQEFKVL